MLLQLIDWKWPSCDWLPQKLGIIVHFLIRLDSEWTRWHLTVAHDFRSYLMMCACFSTPFQPLHWMHHEKLCSFFRSVACWICNDFHNQYWICANNENGFTLILPPIKEKPIRLAPDLMHNVKWWVYRTFDNGWQSRHHSNLSLSTQPLALHWVSCNKNSSDNTFQLP